MAFYERMVEAEPRSLFGLGPYEQPKPKQPVRVGSSNDRRRAEPRKYYQVQHLGWMPADGLYGSEFVSPVLNKSAWLADEDVRSVPYTVLTLTDASITVIDSTVNTLDTVYKLRSAAIATGKAVNGSKSAAANGSGNGTRVVLDGNSLAYVQLGDARLSDHMAMVRLGDEKEKRVAEVHVYKFTDSRQAAALYDELMKIVSTTEHLQKVRGIEKEAYRKALISKCSEQLLKELSARDESQLVNIQNSQQSRALRDELVARLKCAEVIVLPQRDYDVDDDDEDNADFTEDSSETASATKSYSVPVSPPAPKPKVCSVSQSAAGVYLPPPDYDDNFGDVYGQVTLRRPLPSGTFAQMSTQRDLALSANRNPNPRGASRNPQFISPAPSRSNLLRHSSVHGNSNYT